MGYVPEPVDYEMYAIMDYWKFDEAIWLAVSFKLANKNYNAKDDYTMEYEREYKRLSNIVMRSIDSGMIGEFHVVYDMGADNLPLLDMSCVTPYWFVDWVLKKGYELPAELKGTPLTDFRIADIRSKIETEYENYLGSGRTYEIENADILSESQIMEKIREMDLKAGRVPQDSTDQPTSAVQSRPDSKESSPSSVNGAGSQQYRFEKTGKGWCLQYGDAVLVGVKDWLGLTYIKTLLQSPGVKISVLDLQRIAGDSDGGGQQVYEQDGYGDEYTGSGVAAWETIDSTAKGSYRSRLEVIAGEIEAARNAGNKTKVDALIKEAQVIQKALQQGSFKPKDPVVETNRKRVGKVLTDTLKNIRKLEDAYNYNDHPISGHLKRYLKRGACCSYTACGENLPAWRF